MQFGARTTGFRGQKSKRVALCTAGPEREYTPKTSHIAGVPNPLRAGGYTCCYRSIVVGFDVTDGVGVTAFQVRTIKQK